MKRVMVALLLLALGFSPALAQDTNEHVEEVKVLATTAAEHWLALIDTGRYDESWEQAASYFKKAIPHKQWVDSLQGVRQPLGSVLSRVMRQIRYTTTLPGAPDGEYVVIEYDTVFERKKQAIELITPMLDIDGQWRVSGYYIK